MKKAMPRQARIDAPGSLHHVIIRGIERKPIFHDEKLKGDREGQRSSRLNIQYRVIYSIEKEVVTIYVIDITPHKY